jgi:nucleotide-binding universal stress UspA family protein
MPRGQSRRSVCPEKEVTMNTALIETPALAAGAKGVFSRVLAGVDGSFESVEAARRAAILTEEDGQLTLLAVWEIPPAMVATTGFYGPYDVDTDTLRAEALENLVKAGEATSEQHPAVYKIARGNAAQALVAEVVKDRDSLIVVGSHGLARPVGIVAGSTATAVVHDAPCSVLVARFADEKFPRKIVVGIDGSPESAAAYAAARSLAKRFGAELWPVVAYGGEKIDKRLVEMIVDYHREDLQDDPVSALLAASADADLLVVGSRGLHGLKALGSVSERVAHQADCSVLIVREAPWQRIAEALERWQ